MLHAAATVTPTTEPDECVQIRAVSATARRRSPRLDELSPTGCGKLSGIWSGRKRGGIYTAAVVQKMWPVFALTFAALGAAACGSTPTAPAPSTSAAAPPAPAAPTSLNLNGRWTGSGSDVQGRETLAWTITQNGRGFSGTADMRPLDAADGSCASCHKFKSGAVTGTINGTVVTIKLVFPPGGEGVPTPMCTIVFDLSAAGASTERIAGMYSGDDSCEGSFEGGTFTMDRAR